MTYSTLIVETGENFVGTITLNRPDQLNTFTTPLAIDLQQALLAMDADPKVRAVLVRGAGKAFCAGIDVNELEGKTAMEYREWIERMELPLVTISRMNKPVIAQVHGVAAANGMGLVAACDLAVSVDTARFGVNGIDVGLFCATPSVPLVRNMQPKQAMEMLLTGGFIDAEEARARGLVNRVVPAEQLDAAVDALVNAILAKPREAIAAGKELFYRQSELGIEAAYQLAGQTMACNMMLDVAQEGVQAFIDKREPTWRRPAP